MATTATTKTTTKAKAAPPAKAAAKPVAKAPAKGTKVAAKPIPRGNCNTETFGDRVRRTSQHAEA